MEKNDFSCEPMDIDLSGQSLIDDMDISCVSDINNINISKRPSSRISDSSKDPKLQDNASFKRTTNIKYCHINMKRPSANSKSSILKIITVTSVVIISIITYNIYGLKCCEQPNFNILGETLLNSIYGQSAAINLLIETLKSNVKTKILFFSGGTGVGKTYVSTILLNKLGPCSNKYHYTMPTFENMFSLDLMFGLTMCKRSVVVVDDLDINNTYVIEQIKYLIEKGESLDKEITVILIYNNNCYENFVMNCDKFSAKLLDGFSEIKAIKQVIQFEPLSMKDLEQCITQELGNKNLNTIQFDAVLKNFNVYIDGCKGVHSKLKYLNFL